MSETLIIWVFGVVIFMIVTRELMTWYWKLNELVKLLSIQCKQNNDQKELLAEILNQIKKSNGIEVDFEQDAIATHAAALAEARAPIHVHPEKEDRW